MPDSPSAPNSEPVPNSGYSPNNPQSHATPPGSLKGGAGKKNDAAEDVLRKMPIDADAERAVLSCLLMAPSEMIPIALEKLFVASAGTVINKERDAQAKGFRKKEDPGPSYFYIPAHRIIFETILHLYKSRPNGELDLVTLNAELKDRMLIDEVGGPQAVAELLDDVPTTALFEHYVDILRSKFILRRVILDCTDCVAKAYERPESALDFLDTVERTVLKIRDESDQAKGILDMKTHVMAAVQSIEDMYNSDGNANSSAIMTGYKDLDAMTNGFHGGEMIVIAARPSMGKTSFVMNMVENMTICPEPRAVAVFSLEMSSESLVQRLLCSRAKVQMQKLRSGFLGKSDFPRLMHVADQLAKAPIWIDDTPGLSINELQAKARRLKQQHDIKLIAIDYLQLLKSPDTARRDGREKEVAEISGGLKGIAKELNIPVIVLAQLNRQPDSRGGKPKMSDLRESGSIEQDADLVGLLMRPEYYADDQEDRDEKSGEAEFIIAKQRNGPTGDVLLTFNKEFMRFENRAKEDEPSF